MRAELTSWAVPKSSSSLICGCCLLQGVADRVVLEGEQGVQHAEADPPVLAEPGDRRAGLGVQREPAVLQHQLAVGERADAPLLLLGAAVDARGVPPVREPVDVGRRQVLVGVGPRVVPEGVGQPHRVLVPGVPVGKADLEAGLRVAVVGEPVVGLELDPGGRQQVQRRGRREGVAAHQRAADRVRVGLHEPGHRLGDRPVEGHVAAEPGAGHPHVRVVQGVVRAVGRPVPAGQVRALVERDGLAARARVGRPGVGQVVLAQLDPQGDQVHEGDRQRQPVPGPSPVEPAEPADEAPTCEGWLAHWRTPSGSAESVATGGRTGRNRRRGPDPGEVVRTGHPEACRPSADVRARGRRLPT